MNRLLPVVDHIPDSLGKWVKPAKQVSNAFAKAHSTTALIAGTAKTLQGRLTLVDAVMRGFDARTLGASRKMTVLGAMGALALSKVIRGFKDAGKEARGLDEQTVRAHKHLAEMNAKAAKKVGVGGGGGSSGLASFLRNASIAAVTIKGAKALSSYAQSGYALGDQFHTLSQRTGIAVDQLMILDEAAKSNGIDDITGSVIKMQSVLADAVRNATGPAAHSLTEIGVSARKLVKLSPVEQLKAIGSGINGITNAAMRASAARDIFGREGANLLPLFGDPNAISDATKALGRQGEILKKNASTFSAISTKIRRLVFPRQGFAVALAASLAPRLGRVLDVITNADFTQKGKAFGDWIDKRLREVYSGFKIPRIGFKIPQLSNPFQMPTIPETPAWLQRMGIPNLPQLPALPKKFGGIDVGVGGFNVPGLKKFMPGGKADTEAAGAAGPRTSFFEKPMAGIGAPIVPRGSTSPVSVRSEVFGLTAEQRKRVDAAEYQRFTANRERYGEKKALAGVPQQLDSFLAGRGRLISPGALNASGLSTSRLDSGGLSSAADGPGSRLKASERRRFSDQAFRSALLDDPAAQRNGTPGGAYGVVRRGDAKLRKEAEKDNERQNLFKDLMQALGRAVAATEATAEALAE